MLPAHHRTDEDQVRDLSGVGLHRFSNGDVCSGLTDTIWTPETGTARLHLQLPVAFKGAAAERQHQTGGPDVEPAHTDGQNHSDFLRLLPDATAMNTHTGHRMKEVSE